ncbi:MAG: site-specific integrase [bacterium]|nr:site-specific integrase [bacterium]
MGVKVRTRQTDQGVVYYLDIIQEGRRRKKSIEASTLREAKLIAIQVEAKLLQEGWKETRALSNTLSAFTAEFLHGTRSTKAEASRKLDKHSLDLLRQHLGDVRLDAISREDIESFRQWRVRFVKPVSVNTELRHVKAALSSAVEMGVIQSNPASRVKMCRVPKSTHPEYLTTDEISRLRTACTNSPDLLDMVDFALNTGLRRGELASVGWEDIDLDRSVILVRSKDGFQTKSGRDRQVPLNAAARTLLDKMCNGRPPPKGQVFKFGYWWFGKLFNRAVEIAKLPPTTSPHTLRHTFASHLVMQGVDLRSVKEILGHSDIKVTMVYSHLSPGHLAATVEKLPY